MEPSKARAEVHDFARDLFLGQRATQDSLHKTGRRNKRRHPTWDECLAESRRIRLRRERDHSYYNDTSVHL